MLCGDIKNQKQVLALVSLDSMKCFPCPEFLIVSFEQPVPLCHSLSPLAEKSSMPESAPIVHWIQILDILY